MRIGARTATQERDAAARIQASTWGQRCRRRAASPERQTRRRASPAKDTPHEPRWTEAKQPHHASHANGNATTRASGIKRTTPQATNPTTGRENRTRTARRPVSRQARRGERTSDETINETINGGRPTGRTRPTTTPDGKQNEAATSHDETEQRRQHPMTISP